MDKIIKIMKKPGIKNCIRINSEEDIPDFLTDAIKVDGDKLILDCIEGVETIPIGSVIAYEKLENGKINVWNKANYKETTKEVDGVFYEMPKVNLAIEITENLPETIIEELKGNLWIEDGVYVLKTDWGLSKCEPNNGYIIIYGRKENGKLDANFISKETPSFKEYYVVDENNEIIDSLEEYDMKEKLDHNIKL